MYLTIALRKDVATVEEAQILVDIVKAKLADHPEVKISGTVSAQLIVEVPA